MAEHHNVGIGKPLAYPPLTTGTRAGVMHHGNNDAVEIERQHLGKDADQREVVVAQDSMHRRVGAQGVEERNVDDVARMQDDVGLVEGPLDRSGQPPRRPRPHVRVGEDHSTHAGSGQNQVRALRTIACLMRV